MSGRGAVSRREFLMLSGLTLWALAARDSYVRAGRIIAPVEEVTAEEPAVPRDKTVERRTVSAMHEDRPQEQEYNTPLARLARDIPLMVPGIGRIARYIPPDTDKLAIHVRQCHRNDFFTMPDEDIEEMEAIHDDMYVAMRYFIHNFGVRDVFSEGVTAEGRDMFLQYVRRCMPEGTEEFCRQSRRRYRSHAQALDRQIIRLMDMHREMMIEGTDPYDRALYLRMLEDSPRAKVPRVCLDGTIESIARIEEGLDRLCRSANAFFDYTYANIRLYLQGYIRIQGAEDRETNRRAVVATENRAYSLSDDPQEIAELERREDAANRERDRVALDRIAEHRADACMLQYGANHDFRRAAREWNRREQMRASPRASIAVVELTPTAYIEMEHRQGYTNNAADKL